MIASRIELTAAVGLGLLAVASLAIAPHHLPRVDLCLFKALLDVPCPGCGMTRALCHLGHGRLAEAVSENPLSPAVYLLLWGSLTWLLLRIARRCRQASLTVATGKP